VVRDVLAMMITLTTYGASLTEEERRWVDQEIILPAEPVRQGADPAETEHAPLVLAHDQLHHVGALIGSALGDRLRLRIWALTVQKWYAHTVIAASAQPVSRIVRSIENAVREGLELKRPVWGQGYDKRLCFDEDSVRQWIAYVQRNNLAAGRPANPWPFIESAAT
jgi:hypothetical protein